MSSSADTNQSESSTTETVPRNFWLGVINGILFQGANALVEPSLVMSPFIFTYTGNRILAGLPQALYYIGWQWPQALLPGLVEHRRRKMPIYLLSVVTRASSLAVLCLLVFFLDRFPVSLGVVLFIVFYAAFTSAFGIAAIPFFDIVAKSVKPTQRGAFFGLRRVVGGIFAAGMGSVLYAILSRPERFPFPRNYSLVFVIALGIMLVAVSCFLFIREPLHPVRSSRLGLRGFAKQGIESLRTDRAFRGLALFRTVMALGMVPFPFLAPCALEHLDAEPSISGTFVGIFMTVSILVNLIWARMSDRYGNRMVLFCASLFCVAVPGLALGALYAQGILGSGSLVPMALMTGAVICSASVHTAYLMGHINYLLEIAPGPLRPTYLGTVELILLPAALFPVLGGVLASLLSYQAVFVLALMAGLLLFWLSRRLPEPRHRDET